MLSSLRHTCGNVATKVNGSPARRPRRGRLELEGRQVLSTLFGDFTVNSTLGSSGMVANASAANGMSVAVWTDAPIPYTDVYHKDIRAQLYNADGSRRGSEIHVFDDGNDNDSPSVAMDASGNFMVAGAALTPEIGHALTC